MKPLIKWIGGKTQLLKQYAPLLPKKFDRYFEPFLGGGAVFFHLQPGKAFLSDLNEELLNFYQAVRDHPKGILTALKPYQNTQMCFYGTAHTDPESLTIVQRAARFLYLNKTAYGGMYRVNQQGKFNAPFGNYKNPAYPDRKTLLQASTLLRKTKRLGAMDYAKALRNAREGDFVFLDPPYDVPFTKYNAGGFGKDEQQQLAETFRKLDSRGCILMLCNANTPFIRELYKGFKITTVRARRAINSNTAERGPVKEVVVRNV